MWPCPSRLAVRTSGRAFDNAQSHTGRDGPGFPCPAAAGSGTPAARRHPHLPAARPWPSTHAAMSDPATPASTRPSTRAWRGRARPAGGQTSSSQSQARRRAVRRRAPGIRGKILARDQAANRQRRLVEHQPPHRRLHGGSQRADAPNEWPTRLASRPATDSTAAASSYSRPMA